MRKVIVAIFYAVSLFFPLYGGVVCFDIPHPVINGMAGVSFSICAACGEVAGIIAECHSSIIVGYGHSSSNIIIII